MTNILQHTIQKERNQRVVSSSQAQNQFGELVSWIVDNGGEVVIKRRGEPEIAMMPFGDYEEAKRLRSDAERKAAFERLKALRARVQARDSEQLTDQEALQMGDDLAREAI